MMDLRIRVLAAAFALGLLGMSPAVARDGISLVPSDTCPDEMLPLGLDKPPPEYPNVERVIAS